MPPNTSCPSLRRPPFANGHAGDFAHRQSVEHGDRNRPDARFVLHVENGSVDKMPVGIGAVEHHDQAAEIGAGVHHPQHRDILTNKLHTVLYVGVTTSLSRRMKEHAAGQSAFTRRYNVHKLIYAEEYRDVRDAIAREKQIKSWSRKRKIGLIDSQNSLWKDLSDGFV